MTTREVSILATEACRLLTAAGWAVTYEEHAVVLRSGRMVREIVYDDSLGSLVPKPEVDVLVLLGKRRHG
jgi:hypothetical protein